MRLVNIGSGFSGLDGWINYDRSILARLPKWLVRLAGRRGWIDKGYATIKWPDIIIRDIRKPLPEAKCSVDWVYCSHVLEHLYRWEALEVLREARRMLKKGGRIRIVVPDLDKVWSLYDPSDPEKSLWVFYFMGKNEYKKPSLWYRFQALFQRGHEFMYNDKMMVDLLVMAGFKKISVSEYRYGRMPDVEKLDFLLLPHS